LKTEADQALKDALPILQNSVEQLDKLNRGDISEIKMNNNPHALVKYTMECVAVLFEEKQDWDNIKKNILSDTNLLSKMKNLKGENITQATKEKLKKKCNFFNFYLLKVISNPLFVPNEMKLINMAAKSICEWIHAVNNFTDVYAEIKRKKENC
jgi:dynein heavy chain